MNLRHCIFSFIGEVKGLPLSYLVGQGASSIPNTNWRDLPLEETLSSLEATDLIDPQASSTAIIDEREPQNLQNPRKDRDQLRLP